MSKTIILCGLDLNNMGLGPEFAANRNPDGMPAWIPIHRLGKWQHPHYGVLVMTEEKMRQAVANFCGCVHRPDSPVEAQVPVDTRHQGDAACGWLQDLRIALPVLWGRVVWTNRGKGIVLDRRYRYVSPRYLDDPLRGPILQEIALTSRPFLEMPAIGATGSTILLSDDQAVVIGGYGDYGPNAFTLEEIREAQEWAAEEYRKQGKIPRSL